MSSVSCWEGSMGPRVQTLQLARSILGRAHRTLYQRHPTTPDNPSKSEQFPRPRENGSHSSMASSVRSPLGFASGPWLVRAEGLGVGILFSEEISALTFLIYYN